MFSTQLRCPKILLVVAASAAMLSSGANARADQPQMVVLTIMFRTDFEQFESLPMPYGEDAIGIVLDGTKPSSSTAVAVDATFDSFAGGYYKTDGRYMAKGGPTNATVWVSSTGPSLPAHGFISLKKAEIWEYTSGLADESGGVYYRDEIGGTGLAFIRGSFELQY